MTLDRSGQPSKQYDACGRHIVQEPNYYPTGIAFRSVSVVPPQMPYGSRIFIAYVMHSDLLGQTWQIAFARISRLSRSSFFSNEPGGKNKSEWFPLQSACACQSLDICATDHSSYLTNNTTEHNRQVARLPGKY
jgi:hypothetical protein